MSLSGDIIGSGVALAGLILVFLGAISTSFNSYQKQEQNSVRGRYQKRAWFAFVGFCLRSSSGRPGNVWPVVFRPSAWSVTALVLLLIAFGWVVVAALLLRPGDYVMALTLEAGRNSRQLVLLLSSKSTAPCG